MAFNVKKRGRLIYYYGGDHPTLSALVTEELDKGDLKIYFAGLTGGHSAMGVLNRDELVRMEPSIEVELVFRSWEQWLQEAAICDSIAKIDFIEVHAFGAQPKDVNPLTEPQRFEEEQRRILEAFPRARTLISMVVRLNRDALRSTSRSTSDLEYLCAMKRLDEAARRIIPRLAEQGVRAIAPATGFPMDQDHWPDRSWAVAHKLVAEAAGMGRRGLNRLLLHPRFGGHVVLGTIILDAEVAPLGEPLDFDPCLQCKLCVAVCPVGSVGSDGHFSFSNCIVHNYRDRM